MAERLSVSVTFQALVARVKTLEDNGVPTSITAANITAALGYVPANKAGETFGGQVFVTTATDEKVRLTGTDSPYINAFSIDSTQIGYLQWNNADGSANLVGTGRVKLWAGGSNIMWATATAAHIVGYLDVTGAASIGDANFNLNLNSAVNPALSFDAGGDRFEFNRAANIFGWYVAGTVKASLDATGFSTAGPIFPGADANFNLAYAGGVPQIAFDAGDAYYYDRTANQHKWQIGGATKAVLDTNGLILPGALTAGSYVQIGDPTFFLQLANAGISPEIVFDSGGDFLGYNRPGNIFSFAIGGVEACSITSTGLTAPSLHVDANFYMGMGAGPYVSFDPNDFLIYDRTANQFQFGIGSQIEVTIDQTNGLKSNRLMTAPSFAVDGNFGLLLTGAAPTVLFDTGDSLSYNRTTNKLSFNIGGAERASVSASGILADKVSIDSAFYASISSALPTVTFDAGDYLAYDRPSNQFKFYIGGVNAFQIGASGPVFGAQVQAPDFFCPPDPGNGKGGIEIKATGNSATTSGVLSLWDGVGNENTRIYAVNASYTFYANLLSAGHYFYGGIVQIKDGLAFDGLTGVPTYADNTAAIAGGLSVGRVYRTATGQLMIRY